MRRFGLDNLMVIVAYLGTVAVNALAVTLPIGGRTTAEVSDLYPTLFVPANYVFGIWGVIYLLLAVYAVAQALPALRANERVQSVAWPFVLSGVLNAVWLVLWQTLLVYWSVLVMLLLLATLLVIYMRLRGGVRASPAERWTVRLPFSIYLGWISVATIANVSAALYHAQWSGWGLPAATWALIMLGVATLLGLLMLWTRRDVGYAAVLVWAFLGIAVKQRPVESVAFGALAAAVVIALAGVALAGRYSGPERRASRQKA